MNEIDWNKRWRESRLNYTLGQQRVCSADFWDRMWKQDGKSGTTENGRLEWIISKARISPEDTVLDVGSGPGVLTLPIARKAKHVTALDMSLVALRNIEEKAKKEGLSNINCINQKWEDIEPGKDVAQYDTIITSYALTMLDLKAALSKMNQIAKRAVYIFEAAGSKYWHFQELWPRLYGEKFVPSPDYIYIVNVLYQMGIFANVETSEYELRQRFSTLDEAVQRWQEKLDITTPEAIGIVRDYLSQTLKKEKGGLYLKDAQKMVAIWWEKGSE